MKSTHFGACLGLARDRLIRLGWATPASPNQFLRFLVFSRRFFLHHISEQQCFWGCRLRCIDVPSFQLRFL